MKKLIVGLALLSLCGIVLSCDREKAPEEEQQLFGDFFIRYLADNQELKAQATFVEGYSLETAGPKTFLGGISFLNSAMDPRELPGKMVRYELRTKADYQESFSFKFKDDQGSRREYTTAMTPIRDFFLKDGVSKTNGMYLTVNGGLLESGQSLVLLFSDAENKATTIVIQGPSRDINYFVSGPELSNVSPGKGLLYLVKKQQKKELAGGINAVSAIEYYTATLEIEVVE